MIPALSAYIGQVDLGSTYRYLNLTPERFRAQLDKLSARRAKRRWAGQSVAYEISGGALTLASKHYIFQNRFPMLALPPLKNHRLEITTRK